MPAGDPLHRRAEDAACPALGVAANLVLDLARKHGTVAAELILELAQQQLPCLTGAQAAQALQLADLILLGLLEPLGLVLEVARAVFERALLALHLGQPDIERLLLREQALLDPSDLRAAGLELGCRAGIGGRRRDPGSGGHSGRGLDQVRVAGLGTGLRWRSGVTDCSSLGSAPISGDYDDSGDCCGDDRREHDFHMTHLLVARARMRWTLAISSGPRTAPWGAQA